MFKKILVLFMSGLFLILGIGFVFRKAYVKDDYRNDKTDSYLSAWSEAVDEEKAADEDYLMTAGSDIRPVEIVPSAAQSDILPSNKTDSVKESSNPAESDTAKNDSDDKEKEEVKEEVKVEPSKKPDSEKLSHTHKWKEIIEEQYILVKEGYTEKILVKEAEDLPYTEYANGYRCRCGAEFMTVGEYKEHMYSYMDTEFNNHCSYSTAKIPVKTYYIHYDAVYKEVVHEPVYDLKMTVTGYICEICKETK